MVAGLTDTLAVRGTTPRDAVAVEPSRVAVRVNEPLPCTAEHPNLPEVPPAGTTAGAQLSAPFAGLTEIPTSVP